MQLIDTLEAGGAERVAVNIANSLARRGYDSYICATRKGGPLLGELDEAAHCILLGRRNRYDVIAFFRLIKIIREKKIQVLHAHSSSLFLGSIAARICGCKLIWHDHFGPGESITRPLFLYRSFTQNATWIFSVTRGLANWAKTSLNHSIVHVQYLPNFIIVKKSRNKVVDLTVEKGKRIICVANIREVKDQIGLLRAFKQVFEQHPDVHLFLVGASAEPAYYEAVAAEREHLDLENHVTFMGKRDDIMDVLACSDIAVLSSRSEGFPLTLLEYGCAQLPVVATNVGECAEILDNGAAGILVPANDPSALAAGMLRYLDDPDLAKEFAQKLHTRVQREYSEAAIMDKIESVYQSIVSGSNSK